MCHLVENAFLKLKQWRGVATGYAKKASALGKSMSESILELENRLKSLDVEKDNLKKAEEDIRFISSTAKDINKQIQYITSV